MKVLRYIFSLFIASMFALMTFSSCNNFEGSQEIPAYIHVDTFLLTTNYEIEGAASHKITDVWLYIDNNLQGCYEMPATIPVLERGKHKITIYPGIKLNGISSTRTINPFYKPYIIEELELEEKVIDTIHPSTTYYSKDESTLEFAFKDDFERQIFVEDSNGSDTAIIRTDRDAPERWDDEFNNSHYSGYVWLGDTINNFCFTSTELRDLPNQGNSIFLEIDYKCTEVFEVGLYAKISQMEIIPLVYVNPSPTWNKIYINIGPSITDTKDAEYFKFYIAGMIDKNSEAEYYFDNLKLVYRD
ncbi:MAG: hypothetical protein J6R17_07900 [Bacteroidales bacterium]|nr:hypothetical protein [Bacteroidales bacterium]MBO5849110.1 hypothetical protein [Bacteroidales bacterium]MBO5854775.1 hypothetical protein [Bacteroidales bacterium]